MKTKKFIDILPRLGTKVLIKIVYSKLYIEEAFVDEKFLNAKKSMGTIGTYICWVSVLVVMQFL
jgi:hypothetical protein